MFILRNILTPLQDQISPSRKGTERSRWFIYPLLAVITHFTSSRIPNLLRCLQTLFDRPICQHRFYTFLASPKLPWLRLWTTLWLPHSRVNRKSDLDSVSCGGPTA